MFDEEKNTMYAKLSAEISVKTNIHYDVLIEYQSDSSQQLQT